jgi:excisionase family DNA binding protein
MTVFNDMGKPSLQEEQEDEILTLDEAATFLKVKKRTLYDFVERNTIPHLRAGRLIRFSRRTLLDWMKREAEARHHSF